MSAARGRVNQCLYYARVLLSGWRQQLASDELPVSVVNGAFGESVQSQLRAAYGWFLLELAGAAQLPARPPQSASQLPEAASGIAVSAELREFAAMEQHGWLQAMLDDYAPAPAQTPRRPGLIVASTDAVAGDWQTLDSWHQQLSRIIDRMSQSLDEC